MLNSTKGEPVGKICHEFCEKRTEPCEGCSALLTFGDGQIHETVRQSPIDGKWLHICSVPVKDECGTVVQVLESSTDIIAFKQTEEARDRALKELEALKNRLSS